MEAAGFPCSPSPTNPHPKPPYFRGGYNTARHGRDAAPLAGLQIETYYRGVRDTPQSRKKFAQALASTLETYLSVHLGVGLVADDRLANAVDGLLTHQLLPEKCLARFMDPPGVIAGQCRPGHEWRPSRSLDRCGRLRPHRHYK